MRFLFSFPFSYTPEPLFIIFCKYSVFREVALEYLNTSHRMVRKLLEALIGNLGVELDESKIDAYIGKKMVNMNFIQHVLILNSQLV